MYFVHHARQPNLLREGGGAIKNLEYVKYIHKNLLLMAYFQSTNNLFPDKKIVVLTMTMTMMVIHVLIETKEPDEQCGIYNSYII